MKTSIKKHQFASIISVCFVLGFVSIANSEYYTILHEFQGGAGDGSAPLFSTPIIDGNTLYGMTENGGANNIGVIFKMNKDGSGYTNIHEFSYGQDNGQWPAGSLTLHNGKLYGMTRYGGFYGQGALFRIDIDGNNFTNLHSFSDWTDDGGDPFGSLTLSGNTFYGMTSSGGAAGFGKGVLFKMDIDGSNYTNLHIFSNAADNGSVPWGDVTLSGSTLYGMTRGGGSNSFGVVFKVNTDGSNYTNLHQFGGGNNNGVQPCGNVTLNGSYLYGMAPFGGYDNKGVLFRVGTDGTGYTNLHEFPGSSADGRSPYGSLILSNDFLFGMTYMGGKESGSGGGTIFKINLNGSGYTNLHVFDGGINDGERSHGSLLNVGDEFYGMTEFGGVSNLGIIFMYSEIPEPWFIWIIGLIFPFLKGLKVR